MGGCGDEPGPGVGAVSARRWPKPEHATCGSVPLMNAIGTGRMHSPEGSSSTRSVATRSGIGKSSLGLSTRIRSEEHTSELQSQSNIVCRLLLEKQKTKDTL